jgi:hypothetical protein
VTCAPRRLRSGGNARGARHQSMRRCRGAIRR